ncbi:MAG TPA: hypothetical protein VKR29_05345, partial [Candidatus Binataceae bacterium]|nr:hypothetical protein [Candidatus Binataceae bacterium]
LVILKQARRASLKNLGRAYISFTTISIPMVLSSGCRVPHALTRVLAVGREAVCATGILQLRVALASE